MNKLEKYRLQIDEIDTKIIELFEKRMDIVKNVINYKIENNIPILDTSRESSMLDKNIRKINNHEYDEYYASILGGFLKASKDMQSDILDIRKKKINK